MSLFASMRLARGTGVLWYGSRVFDEYFWNLVYGSIQLYILCDFFADCVRTKDIEMVHYIIRN